MSLRAPYLVRRKYRFSFRISVPHDLRHLFELREVVRTLKTHDKLAAIPIALRMASAYKTLFEAARQGVMVMDEKKLQAVLRTARLKIRLHETQDELEQHKEDARKLARQKEQQYELALLRQRVELLEKLGSGAPTSSQSQKSLVRLSAVIEDFLKKYPSEKGAMLKKHQVSLRLFLGIVGNRPISDIKQADLNRFFETMAQLPPRWADLCKARGITPTALAKEKHARVLGPKAFDDTYKASIRAFLSAAIRDWGDQGFPEHLTVRAIEYRGPRKEGERKQRALTLPELERLFEGVEMRAFAGDAGQAHKFWLPHIALFTGARVNEICQLNPQTDFLCDDEGGWYFWFTDDTDGDNRIQKSTKNVGSKRKMPVHSKLVELGIERYIERVKTSGAKLLFPAWEPMRKRASGQAEKWFRGFLREIGLRDETPGASVLGMHTFRSTFLNRALNLGVSDAFRLVGHAEEGKSKVTRGYEGELSLVKKKEILEEIVFELKFFSPC